MEERGLGLGPKRSRGVPRYAAATILVGNAVGSDRGWLAGFPIVTRR